MQGCESRMFQQGRTGRGKRLTPVDWDVGIAEQEPGKEQQSHHIRWQRLQYGAVTSGGKVTPSTRLTYNPGSFSQENLPHAQRHDQKLCVGNPWDDSPHWRRPCWVRMPPLCMPALQHIGPSQILPMLATWTFDKHETQDDGSN